MSYQRDISENQISAEKDPERSIFTTKQGELPTKGSIILPLSYPGGSLATTLVGPLRRGRALEAEDRVTDRTGRITP